MAFVVRRTAFDLTRPERKQGLRPIQGLDLALLVHTEDQRVLGRVHIQAHNVAHLLSINWGSGDSLKVSAR